RDPRGEFRTVRYAEGVESLDDLQEGQWLEGVVTNVTHFGAFVDIGVHQDGLVHVSELADRFVKDPLTVVKPGQIVRVRVLSVDKARQRIALSMRAQHERSGKPNSVPSGTTATAHNGAHNRSRTATPAKHNPTRPQEPVTALALALARAQQEKSAR
ncbi:MAG TPA: S1 RNA-binding domain-containing protein, partial [Hydrogenophilus thermoluteolus]|nr:S1 RNA-binding domain-containing protein [Hydrogenophilus thermoluteolus]